MNGNRLNLGSFEWQVLVLCDADAHVTTITGNILRNVFKLQEIDEFYRKKTHLLIE